MRRRTSAALAVLVTLPLLTSCGDTNRAEANPETAKPVKLASVKPTVYPPKPSKSAEAAPAASGSSAPAESAPPAAEPGTVTASPENKFDPAELTVKVGETVTWKNAGGFHTVTGGEPGKPDSASPIGDKPLADASATHQVKFDKPGTYPYFCQPHGALGMKGTIVVA